MSIRIFQLSFKNSGRSIAVGRSLFKTVIFLHGLVVQVLTIYHKENLINIGKQGSKPGGLKGSQRLARSCGMPYIAPTGYRSIFFIIICNLNTIQDTLCCRNLIRSHYHQHFFRGEDAVLCQNI